MAEPRANSRSRIVAQLADSELDLLVIGGGITGAGIARDAALRGLRVGLIDKGDFASGTSSKSSKLIHGGLRYLQQARLRLVFEAVQERALLMELAPHLVVPIEFLIPAYRRGFFAEVWAGLTLYDILALGRPPAGHRRYRPRQMARVEPMLRQESLVGGLLYSDCATNDARLVLENVLDAQELGALCANYVRAVEPIRRRGRIIGVVASDAATGAELPILARVIVGALGPWSERMLGAWGSLSHRPLLRPTKGTHVVVDAARFPVRHAVTMATRDARIVFAIPSLRRTVIGTTDTDDAGQNDELAATREEAVYLLATANFYFPEVKLRMEDVLSTYAGLRPLLAGEGSASSVSREHEIFLTPDGMIVIVGGKLTTYRKMAAEVTDRVVSRLFDMGFGETTKPCATRERRFPRALRPGLTPSAQATWLASAFHLDETVALHLSHTYGTAAEHVLRSGSPTSIDAELPFLWCEVDFAIAQEHALTVEDVLWRRVPLALYGRDQGLSASPKVAAKLLDAHGPSAYLAQQVDQYRRSIERSRAFRQER